MSSYLFRNRDFHKLGGNVLQNLNEIFGYDEL